MTEVPGTPDPLGDASAGEGHEVTSEDGRLAEIHAQLEKFAIPPELLERLFAFSPVGFQLYDANGRSLLTNRAFLEMFGSVPPPEYNVMEDEIAERQGVLGLIRRAFAGEPVRLPPVWYDPRELKRVSVSEGRRVAIDATFFPVFDPQGRVSHVGVIFKDVTAELLARQEAESERDLLRAIVEQSGDGLIVTDAEGNIRIFNPEAERQHGRPRQDVRPEDSVEAYGLETEEGDPLPFEENPLWRASHGERIENIQWVVRRPDGSRRLLSGTATPLRRADGELYGAMVITRDETKRRQVAEERRVAEFKDRVIGILGHDLRTPLSAIKAAASLLSRSRNASEAELRASVERLVALIDRSTDRMSRMISDVLDFTRARMGGGIPVEKRPMNLGAVAMGVVEELRASNPERELRLETRGSLTGNWDADRLAQVVQNLVGNALLHGQPKEPVDVVVEGSEAKVRLTVHNHGPPISPDTLVRMFDPFRRGKAPHAGRDEGIGLGLYIVRSIVEAHGGHVTVKSDAAEGTRFTVLLPRG